jgi:DNA-binding NtrC family response regulator
MSTQSDILMMDANHRDHGFAILAHARNNGAADGFTRPDHGAEFVARAAESNDPSRGEEQPHPRTFHDDVAAKDELGLRPHIEIPPGTSLEDLERAAVEKALQVHRGNRTHAAKTLGISVRTLQRKLKAWRMPALMLERHSPRPDCMSPFAS